MGKVLLARPFLNQRADEHKIGTRVRVTDEQLPRNADIAKDCEQRMDGCLLQSSLRLLLALEFGCGETPRVQRELLDAGQAIIGGRGGVCE